MGNFFRPNDIVISETGTSSFGMIQTPLPKGSINVSQVLWGSIGYAGGATLGALLAAEESDVKRRVILLTGDGSLQLTVQEIATMVRLNLKPIIVVLYVLVSSSFSARLADLLFLYPRLLLATTRATYVHFSSPSPLPSADAHLPSRRLLRSSSTVLPPSTTTLRSSRSVPPSPLPSPPYTYSIFRSQWQSILDVFNAYEQPIPTKSWLASTRGDLEKILDDESFAKADKIQLLEVRMEKLDAPEALVKQGKLVRLPFLSFLSFRGC
jgi:hypothetical protein